MEQTFIKFTLRLACILLLAARPVPGANPPALPATDKPKPPAAETDARLHADGKGWRLDKARITDPKRPRVLLIGDSILNGYLKQATAALEGKATWTPG